MSNQNTTTLVGNVTREPELRFTPSGRAVAQFGLAINRRKRDESGAWVDGDTSFFDVVCWGELGENVAASLGKGTRVIVLGELRQRSWETEPTDGTEPQKRSKIEVVADSVGPELRWATCSVIKNERKGPDGAPPVELEEEF